MRIVDTVRQSLAWGERTPAPHFGRGKTRVQLLKALLEKDGPAPAPIVVRPQPIALPAIQWPDTPQPF